MLIHIDFRKGWHTFMNWKGKLTAMLLAGLAVCSTAPTASAHHHKTPQETDTAQTAKASGSAQLIDKNRLQALLRGDTQEEPQTETAAPVSRMMKLWNVESRDTGGTLLFSDSPEYVTRPGILYQDTVNGDARVLYYHLNNTDKPAKVGVVLEGTQKEFTIVRVTRGGMSRPSSDYLKVGKATQVEYFGTKRNDTLYLLNGSRKMLNTDMDRTILRPGELVYGVFDFHADHPVKVSVILYPSGRDPYKFLDTAPILPKDEQRLRGTFKGMNRVISSRQAYNPDSDGIVYFPLADDLHDLYRTGIDATDGSAVTNYGNYGVLYKIEIPTMGKMATQYYLSPLGGVYAGAMTVKSGYAGKSNLLQQPFGRTYFGDTTPPEPECVTEAREEGLALLTDSTELADLGHYQNNIQTSFEYSPPGASNLPVNIIMMPAGKKIE